MIHLKQLCTAFIISSLCASYALHADTGRLATNEARAAYQARMQCAFNQTLGRSTYDISTEANGDLENIADYAAMFHKTLEHDASTGILTPAGAKNFEKLLKALATDNQADFNAIARAAGAGKLVNPQGAFAFSLEGCDSSLIPMPAAFTLDSADAAADMIEDYLKAICRDVAFHDYGTGANTDDDGHGGSITAQAAAVLSDLGAAYHGPRNSEGDVDTSVLFRGTSSGDLVGPYVSQFLLLPLRPVSQKLLEAPQYVPVAQRREFGVSWDDFVNIENGKTPKAYNANDFDGTRHITSGRDLATWVHLDGPYEACYNAVNILSTRSFPFSSALPYVNGSITNEAPFVTMGVPDVLAMVGNVACEALKHAWSHKWRASLRLRPEAMAGLIHQAKVNENNPYNLHSSLFSSHADIDVLEWAKERNALQALIGVDPLQLLSEEEASTYLLGQVFPEGSPAHPSYPAGHAVIAGACATVVKAIYNDTTKINAKVTPVKVNPSDLTSLVNLPDEEGASVITVGSELDKLASNIAIGRNIAGVHYRSDGDQGILLGEEVAIRFLQDHARQYAEATFTGFEFTKRDGTRIRVTPDAVTVLS